MGSIWENGWLADTVIPTTGSANPYGSFDAMRAAIWSAMVAGRDQDFNRVEGSAFSSILAAPALATVDFEPGDDSPLRELVKCNIFDWCVQFLKNNSAFRIGGRELQEYFIESENSKEIDAHALREALMQRDRVNVRRRMVITSEGYVGMVLETVHKNDLIVALLGCTMPMALRPIPTLNHDGEVSKRFEVVGECYIHGLMEGQAMEWLEKGEVDLQDIAIC